jgi:hypothetical protein
MGRQAIVSAWLFGMGLITYRFISRQHQPPIPGSLLAASGAFALLALLSEYGPAAAPAALAAWGLDLAALLNLLPGSLAGPPITTPAGGGAIVSGPSTGPQNRGAAPTQTGA